MDLWTQQGKERVGQIERIALTYIYSAMCEIASRRLGQETLGRTETVALTYTHRHV